MPAPHRNEADQSTQGGSWLAVLAALAMLAGFMYYSWVYPYPSGKPPSIGNFVIFWLRELIVLAFVVIALIADVAIGLIKAVNALMQRWRSRAQDC